MADFHNLPKALAFYHQDAARADDDGAVQLTADEVASLAKKQTPLLVCSRFALPPVVRGAVLWDLMELWAFAYPAQSCVPSVQGLAKFFNKPVPTDAQQAACFVFQAAAWLLQGLESNSAPQTRAVAQMMTDGGWSWGRLVLDALPRTPKEEVKPFTALLGTLPRWQIPNKAQQQQKKSSTQVKADPVMAQEILSQALRGAGAKDENKNETRPAQVNYMNQANALFSKGVAQVLLAQADTGTGKTLGYLVPAYLAAKQKGESVWIVTYTRALQTQIARESAKLPPHKLAIRKGRENYLCLLNFEQAVERKEQPVLSGLVARWVRASKDGDIRGGDFPSWLATEQGSAVWLRRITDHSENCIHAACPHYRNCFVERQKIEALDADIVIANHALIMASPPSPDSEPVHYIFDEGHHLFAVADSTFSFHLTGQWMARVRFWLLGGTGGAALRVRRFSTAGLRQRLGEVLEKQPHLLPLLEEAESKASFLPQTGWQERIAATQPLSVAENFLNEVRQKVMAAQTSKDEGYDLECEPSLVPSSARLELNLAALQKALAKLLSALRVLDDKALLSIIHVLEGWAERELPALSKMCAQLQQEGGLVQWVDRFIVERRDGRESNYGMMRNALDPAAAFAENILSHAKASLITSASLHPMRYEGDDGDNGADEAGEFLQQWAEWQTGAKHLSLPALHAAHPSPFDYASRTKMLILTDVPKHTKGKAEAMAALFCASGGGGLGLWTSIRRLGQAYDVIARRLKGEPFNLLSQHHDRASLSTLIDIFRQEEDSCLLGTDALRDGIDVPGRSLRLLVFDRVPWGRPDILHKKRRALFPSGFYDDMIVSLRLQQAFGRLIRKEDDYGIFVLLDNRFPSRMERIFPKEMVIERLKTADAIEEVKKFNLTH